MNVGKLKRVAIKEFTRSPAKTGFLLAALPVALYFCGPLVLGAIKKSSPSAGAIPAGNVAKQAAFVLPSASRRGATTTRVEPSWAEVTRSLADDLWAVPTSIPAEARNPFFAGGRDMTDESIAAVYKDEQIVLRENETESPSPAEQGSVSSNPIRDLGLKLNATMVGPRSRLATINGKTYSEGEAIPVIIDTGLDAGTVRTVRVELSQVDRRFVVLQWDGYRHRLQLPTEETKDVIVVKSTPKSGAAGARWD